MMMPSDDPEMINNSR
jgi:uncharacterized protein (UPF0335 family)